VLGGRYGRGALLNKGQQSIEVSGSISVIGR
jgi:hypothetical protein